MRVLMICPELPKADKRGVWLPPRDKSSQSDNEEIDTRVIDMSGIPKLKYLQVLPKIYRAIQQVDLVHCHFGYCGWLGLMGQRVTRRRLPIVCRSWG